MDNANVIAKMDSRHVMINAWIYKPMLHTVVIVLQLVPLEKFVKKVSA